MGKSRSKTLKHYGIAVALALISALWVRHFVIEAYRIPTPSMRPTIESGDTLFVLKPPFGLRGELDRGDVIIFQQLQTPASESIKRIVGVSGDQVEVKLGRVILNGKQLTSLSKKGAGRLGAPCAEESIPRQKEPTPKVVTICFEPPMIRDYPLTSVPADSFFVIGDFRSQLTPDLTPNRTWGMIHKDQVVGKANWIWLRSPDASRSNGISSFLRFQSLYLLRRIE